MKSIFSILLLFVMIFNVYSQNISLKYDSLLLEFKTTRKTIENASKLIDISLNLADYSTDTAYNFAYSLQKIIIPDSKYELKCRNLFNFGIIAKMKGKYSESNTYLFESLNIAENNKLDALKIRCQYEIGDLYRSLGIYDKSLFYLFSSLNLARASKLTTSFPRLYDCISSTFYELSYTKTKKYTLKKIPYQNEFDMENIDKYNWLKWSENYADSALMKLKFTRDYRTEINCLNLLGSIKRKQKKYTQALSFLDKAIQKALKAEYFTDIPNYYMNLSSTYYDLKDYKKALEIGLNAYNLSKKINILSHMFVSTDNLVTIYEKLEDYKQALILDRIKNGYHFDIITNENIVRLSELDAQFQAKQRTKEIEYQNMQLIVKSSELRQRNIIIISLLIFCGIFIAGILLIIFYYSRLRSANKKISDQKEELSKLNITKDKLFSIIAHDLRGPIGTLYTILELISTKLPYDFKYEQLIQTALQQSKDTFNMLENLLFWARNQIQNTNPTLENINVYKLIDELKKLYQNIADDKYLKLIIQADGALELRCDREMITIVIRNLITNALKFTPSGGKVQIIAREINDQVLIEVTDTGIGIDKENINKILNPTSFYTTYGTNREKGTGIGIKICKELIEKNGSSLQIKANQPNGTIFYFSLPRAELQTAI